MNQCCVDWSEASIQDKVVSLRNIVAMGLEVVATSNCVVLMEVSSALKPIFDSIRGGDDGGAIVPADATDVCGDMHWDD